MCVCWQVGTGEVVGEGQFMEYQQETVHPVYSVGFGSAMGEKGVWLINERGT